MSRIQARAVELEWARVREQGHASEGRQAPRKVWAVKALKPELTEEEWVAACRAVRECAPAFDGMRRAFDDVVVDSSGSDYGMAAKVSAARQLEGLKRAAFTRTGAAKAPVCVEWIAQMWTLPEMAQALGSTRRTGPRLTSRIVPDVRPVKPFVRLVLMGMAAYFEDCDMDVDAWNKSPHIQAS